MRPTRRTSKREDGYRSGLEAKIAKQILEETGQPASYEDRDDLIEFVIPERTSKYLRDFRLPNGIIVEGKGIFDTEDRAKHLLIKAQRPDLDIRFVFTRSAAPIYPRSPTTMAMWCEKHGFKYADKLIPKSWFKEKA